MNVSNLLTPPTSHLPRRLLGAAIGVGVLWWLPFSLTAFEWSMLQGLAIMFIALGLYDLLSSRLINVFRSAFLLTLGIGLQLLALELVSFGEFLTYWPLAVVTFGLLVIIADAIEDRRPRRYRQANR